MHTTPARLAALFLAAAAARGTLAAEDPRRGDSYPGAIFLYQLDAVTVVYPAGPGDDAETNRRSALSRARFLESLRGTKVRVLADVDASKDDRAANLLLLGWSNRLLGTPEAPRPFEKGIGSLAVFGEAADPEADLLLFHRNPYDPTKFLVFWSRIDPESDRFMMLPRIGSDWALVRDYKPIRQGMFLPGTTWPPRRDVEAEANHAPGLLARVSRLASEKSAHYEVHYDATRVLADEVKAIVAAREAAWTRAAELVGGSGKMSRIDLYVYEDESQKKEITGVADPAHSVPRDSVLHMTRKAARSRSPHEEIHLLARPELGPCYLTAMCEGLAIGLEGSFRGRELSVSAAMIVDTGTLPKLADLLDEERVRRAGEPAFPVAGLFLEWARSVLDPVRFGRLYRLDDGTPDAAGAAAGMPAADLEARFQSWLAKTAASRTTDVAIAKLEREAKDRLEAGDYAGVAAALTKSLALRPSDPQTLFNLGAAEMRLGRLTEAEGRFRKILELDLAPRQSRFRIFSHYQVGRIRDLQGRREEALAEYRAVLALPDEYDAHRLAEERIASPATRDQLE